MHDGRFANNGWLQELPKPLTNLTWDNAALITPATASDRREARDPGVRGAAQRPSTMRPVWIAPGTPTIRSPLHLGYGPRRAGRVGNGIGFNAYQLRTSADPGLRYRRGGRQDRRPCRARVDAGPLVARGRILVRSSTARKPQFAAGSEHGARRPEHQPLAV